jgi:hypothetical protein
MTAEQIARRYQLQFDLAEMRRRLLGFQAVLCRRRERLSEGFV